MTARVRVVRTLGDVTTPRGDGAGIFDQITNWFTGTTANAANAPQVVLDWIADVKARGNVATRWPFDDDFKGDLAERDAVDNSYSLAPDDVVNADRITRGLSTLAPITGDVAAAGEAAGKAVQQASETVLSAPRQALAGALGVNPGVITAVALGALVLWLYGQVRKR